MPKTILIRGNMIKTVIMAGGKGTRLQPLTFIRPKPMIPLVNRPIMQYMIDRLRSSKFPNLIITLSYMADHMKRYFHDGSDLGVDIKYSTERWPLGTGGGVRKAKEHIDDTFFVVSGDVLTDVDFNKLLKFHKKKGGLATLVLTHVDDPAHFGIAVLDDDNQITDYLEKPSPDKVFSNIANTGTYVFEPEIFDYLDIRRGEVDFSKHVFPALIRENAGIYGYVFPGYWNDVGRPESYLKATYDLLEQKFKHDPFGNKIDEEIGRVGDIWVGKNVEIDKKARIEGPVVIGDNCTMEEGCKISKGSVIGNNVLIKRNVNLDGAVIFSNNIIQENSFLNRCIIDTRCFIDKNVIIENGAVIGSLVEIGQNCIVKSSRCITHNVRILPDSIMDYDYFNLTDLK
ncbi:MAG: NDP-sugar synthase [Euryarchaeota archaeon]|nr:NDP-sugar synthase [Euryarchaeota archaeon]